VGGAAVSLARAMAGAAVDGEERPGHAALFRAVDALAGTRCAACERTLCGHEGVLAIASGLEAAARCLPCFARALGAEEADLLRHHRAQLRRRPCWLAAWERATAREPPCGVGASGERGGARDP
jgi:hypothetical protein